MVRRAHGELAWRRAQRLLRTPQPVSAARPGRLLCDGHWRRDFASNDYLGLARDRRLARAAGEAAKRFGWGAGASRLISGTTDLHQALERAIAVWQGTEKALVLSNGFLANLSVLSATARAGDIILSDAANHASLIDGIRLSRADAAIYRHRDMDHLASLLKRIRRRGRARGIWVATESLFSADGDVAPLRVVVALARHYGAWVYVDEAHAVGVYGREGRGLADVQGVLEAVDLRMGTFSKAFGSYGAYVAGPAAVVDLLYNAARPFVFTTALPAPVSAASLEALSVVRKEEWRRARLWKRVREMRQGLLRQGWDLMGSESQILPVRVGTPSALAAIAKRLARAGVWAGALRPPTVPNGGCRLRVSVSAAHSAKDVREALAAFGSVPNKGRKGPRV